MTALRSIGRSSIRAWRVAGSLAAVGLLAGAGACILPDRDIRFVDDDENLHPVRFVDGFTLSDEARCGCEPNKCDGFDFIDEFDPPECPLPFPTTLPNFLDPSLGELGYQFCLCDEGEVYAPENRPQLPNQLVFLEDQDETDAIFVALVLNRPATGDVSEYLAFPSYHQPTRPIPAPLAIDQYEPANRPAPNVRAFQLGVGDDPIDLCNDTGADVNAPGFNTLTILATDRPWFAYPVTVERPDGSTDTEDEIQVGVPDVPAGATYAERTFTFYCSSKESEALPNPPFNFGCSEACQDPEDVEDGG